MSGKRFRPALWIDLCVTDVTAALMAVRERGVIVAMLGRTKKNGALSEDYGIRFEQFSSHGAM
jgi:hypothetical protein